MLSDEQLIRLFKPVTIQDDQMFGTVMSDSKYCKPFLETILGVKIQKIEYLERQKTIGMSIHSKSIRMDIYVEDDQQTVYDVEMQTGQNNNLPKRTRYYQGMIDLNILNRGEDYTHLKKSLVIFVCTFDPLGYDEYIYRCGTYYPLSDGSYHLLEDDAQKIFVNADGHIGDVSDDFKALMQYIMKGKIDNAYTKALDNKVALVNDDDEWKVRYMTLTMKIADERRDAVFRTLYNLYNNNKIDLQTAAEQADMSETDFLKTAKAIFPYNKEDE